MKNIMFSIVFLISCRESKFEKETINQNNSIILGLRSEYGKPSLIEFYKKLYNTAFNLEPIQQSVFPYELRVDLTHSFGHTSFRQRFSDEDSMYAEVSFSVIEIRGDSIYMLNDRLIKSTGRHKYDYTFDIHGFRDDGIIFKTDYDPLILDNVSEWFIQVKIGKSFKTVSIDGRLEDMKDKAVRENVLELIKKISSDFSFSFITDVVEDSVFSNPYR